MTYQPEAQAAAPAHATAPAVPKTTNGWGIAGFVISIVSLLLSCIPFISFIALVPAPFGIITSVVGLVVKGKKRGFAIAGLVLSIVAIVMGLLLSLGLMMALSGVTDFGSFFGGGVEGGVVVEQTTNA